jgi:hypothetical protein
MPDDKIVSLIDKQKARTAEKKIRSENFARIRDAHAILAKAIQTMRNAGVKQSDIADVLRQAAKELG